MFLFTLTIFILVIGVLVLIHELGHYWAARAVGIKVEEFAVGMGPRVWGWVKNNIEYNLRALPIGGYVKMYGEGDYNVKDENSFGGKKPSLRLIVLVAGVFMNFLLASAVFYMQGANLNYQYRNIEGFLGEDYRPWFGEKTKAYIAIRDTMDDSPLKGQVGDFDIITKVNGNEYTIDEFFQTVRESKGKEMTLEVMGYVSDDKREIKVTPVENEKGEGALKIRLGYLSFVKYEGASKLLSGFGQSMNSIQSFFASMGKLISDSFKTNSIVPVADNFGGAIGIFDILGKIITSFGFWGVMELVALFSINLAIFNILPIPALDGGHVVFTLLEMIFRRRLPNAIYNYLTIAGFVFLMGFMLVITSLDLVKHTNVRNVFCNDQRQVRFICDLSDYRQ